jgi:hypothetical protein
MIWFGIPLLTKDNNIWYAEKTIDSLNLSLRVRKENSPIGIAYIARLYINTKNYKGNNIDLCISSSRYTSANLAIKDVSESLKKLLKFVSLLQDCESEEAHFGYENFLD